MQQILENMLMAEGFILGRSLAGKLYYFFQHAKDNFLKEQHYDWGLRAIKAVCRSAGDFLRAKENITPADEEAALLTAAWVNVEAKLSSEDVPGFEAILVELFYGHTADVKPNPALEAAITEAYTATGLKPSPLQMKKTIQLNSVIKVRHGVCLLGAVGSGRRTQVETLGTAITALTGEAINKWFFDADDDSQHPEKGTIGEFGPVGMPLDKFYGVMNEGTW